LQNIWQQIILFSRRVMQMICVWPKIWTLSGRLSLMRTSLLIFSPGGHLLAKRLTMMDAEVSTNTFLTKIIEESVCFMLCEPF
jgi:hypothetical protein